MRSNGRVDWPDAAFGLVFAITLVAFAWTISAFVVPLLLAAAAVALLAPIHSRLDRALHHRRALSSMTMAVATLVVVLAPTAAITYVLVQQASSVVEQLRKALGEGGVAGLLSGRISEPLAPLFRQLDSLGLTHYLTELLDKTAEFLSTHVVAAAVTIGSLLLKSFVFVVGMYYFFLGGPHIVHEVVTLAPLEERHSREILGDVSAMLRVLFVASFVTAVIQGILGAISFWIAGLPHAVLWAGLMAFLALLFSLVPIIGTGLVYVPAGIWLIAHGKVMGGIFVLVWGTVVLGSVEFIVKPYFAKEQVAIHPLVIFLTLFGGIEVLGPIGVLAGPVAGAVVGSFARVWRRDIFPTLVPPGPPQRSTG